MELKDILIKKKNNTLQEYDANRIITAVKASAERCESPLTDNELAMIIAHVENKLLLKSDNVVPVQTMHALVLSALKEVRMDVYDSYLNYRSFVEHMAKDMMKMTKECNAIQFIGDKENANSDSALVSTKRMFQLNVFNKYLYTSSFLLAKELQAIEDGYIYIHDMSARRNTMNCCLFDVRNVLSGGFEMGNIWYNEPKTLDKAFDVIGDIVLMSASQQYGGFTIPEVDTILEPYAEKSFQKYKEKYINRCHMSEKEAEGLAMEDVQRDMEQGFQGWEYKFNTVASSRGDYPFITATFGLGKSVFAKMASITICNVRKEGQGKKGKKKPVLFPKLVFLYDENLHGPKMELEDVFEAGIQCSAKTMYPDWLSLTGEGYVASIYKKYGLAISPMGCRAFLSPWYEKGGMEPADENDKPVFVGRFNIGAVSLHLPMILAKARQENRDFYEVLDYYLEMIRGIHLRTYEYLGKMKASMNPLGFCEGGFYGGNLGLNDNIEPCLKSATASFGITALNELQELYNGKSLVEDGEFALEVMTYINEKIVEFKKEDGRLYAIYGTPAENLCGKQVKQYRMMYGVVKGVSDREYVSNSFHCHVTENISPIQKQDLENRFWNLFNGGKIQYVRYPLGYNIVSMRTLIRRAMEMGFYEGANLSLAYCDDCGHQELEMDVCPVCGSSNLTKIDRMNGYLAYSRVHGDTRLNDAKMAEIKERKSM